MKKHGLDEKEMELVKLLMADCETTGDIQAKLKRLFAGTIEQRPCQPDCVNARLKFTNPSHVPKANQAYRE